MNKNILLIFLLFFLLSSIYIPGQIFDYRYHETPAISWNPMNMKDSRQLSMGGISLFASGNSMQIANPALFPAKKGVDLGFSYGFISYKSFQYWGVNEGVINYEEPLSEYYSFPSSISIRFGFTGLNITAGWYRSSLNDFPDFSFINEYEYEQYDEFNGTFSGSDETFFIAAGIPLSTKLKAGLKIEYSIGARNVEIVDIASYYYFLDGYYQLKDKRSTYSEINKSKIFIPELGFIYDIDQKVRIGICIRYPIKGKVDREIIRSFRNSDGLTINDNYLYRDDHFDVPEVKAGLAYTMDGLKILGSPGRLITGLELKYRKWSDYKFVFYGEEEERALVDIVNAAFGIEYGKKIKKIDLFFRLGFGFDRQPVKEPGTVLKNYSAGFGINYREVQAGIGLLYTAGSTAGIFQDHFTVCASLSKIL